MSNSIWSRNFRILFLFLILCNFPSYALSFISPLAGKILSYSTFLILIVHSFLVRNIPIKDYLIFGFFYFFVSLIVDSRSFEISSSLIVKYFIFFFCIKSVLLTIKYIEIFWILVLGCISIYIEVLLSGDLVGRFSGLYLNPNAAGFAVLIGFIFSLGLVNLRLKYFGQIIFTVAGFLTFSRTFVVLWILVNVITLFYNIKNGINLLLAGLLFISFILFFQDLGLDSIRLQDYSLVLTGELSDNLVENVRSDTWSLYYEDISDNLFFGNGYLSFSGNSNSSVVRSISDQGVHNSFLMVLGEAGIFVFVAFVFFHLRYLFFGFKIFFKSPVYLLLSATLILFLFTSHNFFDNYLVLFLSGWLVHYYNSPSSKFLSIN